MSKVGELLGVGTPETVRTWCHQAEVGAGRRPGVTSEESAGLKRLKQENAEVNMGSQFSQQHDALNIITEAPSSQLTPERLMLEIKQTRLLHTTGDTTATSPP